MTIDFLHIIHSPATDDILPVKTMGRYIDTFQCIIIFVVV